MLGLATRASVMWLLALAPALVPPGAEGRVSAGGALVALLLVAAAVALRKRSRWLPWLVGATLLAAVLGALLVRVPSTRATFAAFAVGCLAWASLVETLRATVLSGRPLRAIVAPALGLAVACAVHGTRLVAWKSDESLAVEQASALRARGDSAGADVALRRCFEANPRACKCVAGAVDAAFAASNWSATVDVSLAGDVSCERAGHLGKVAQAMLMLGRLEAARAAADRALAADPNDAVALLARSVASYALGDRVGALEYGRRGYEGARDLDARLSVTRVLIDQRDLATARRELDVALGRYPSNGPLRYNLALVDDLSGQYGSAREGYLAVLRLDPGLFDARYNLVFLTARAGALDEARHHLARFAEAAPNDPRLPAARARVGATQ